MQAATIVAMLASAPRTVVTVSSIMAAEIDALMSSRTVIARKRAPVQLIRVD